MTGPDKWQATHLRWSSPADRVARVCAAAKALDACGAAWYTVDGIDEGETEVAVRGRWPALAGTSRWHAPCVARPPLFGEGLPPELVTALLVASTARAVTVLRDDAMSGRKRATRQQVAAEVATCYVSLFRDPTERAAALDTHGAWLGRTAKRQGLRLAAPPLPLVVSSAPVDSRLAAVAGLFARVSPGVGGGAPDLVHRLVARTVHIHVVRLRGPDDASLLDHEVAVVAGLRRSLG
ncbi:MAG: hypothetical protein M3P34_05340 [Actinomycetota bacterium]|nr:hypothetical protein [Actinomycetota bacterium]